MSVISLVWMMKTPTPQGLLENPFVPCLGMTPVLVIRNQDSDWNFSLTGLGHGREVKKGEFYLFMSTKGE